MYQILFLVSARLSVCFFVYVLVGVQHYAMQQLQDSGKRSTAWRQEYLCVI